MTYVRLALATAFNSAPEHRWRLWVVPSVAAVFMGLLLASLSSVLLAERVADRQAERSLIVSRSPSATDIFHRADLEYWHGNRIQVAWLTPAGPDKIAALPPGVRRFPAPGEAVVSPALDRLADHHRDLAALYPNRTVLTKDGVSSAGELVAYLRPVAGRDIGGEGQAMRMENGHWVGHRTALVRIAGFGPRGDLPAFGADPPARWVVPAMALGFGLLPGITLLAVGLATSSRRRDLRFQLLWALGLSGWRVRWVVVLESWFLVLPGLVVGALAWAALAPHCAHIPVLGISLLRGDLALPPTLLGALVPVALILSALAALATSAAVSPDRPRPTVSGSEVSGLALVPLAASALIFAAAALTPFGNAVPLVPLASLVAIAGAPLVVPAVMVGVGRRLAVSPRVAVAVAGRSMEHDPRRSARPFLGLTALMVITLFASTFFAFSDGIGREVPVGVGGVEGVAVQWHEVRSGDLAAFSHALGVGTVLRYGVSGAHRNDEERHHVDGVGMTLDVGATCADLRQIVAVSCEKGQPHVLEHRAAHQLAANLARALAEPVQAVRLVGRRGVSPTGRVVVLGRSTLDTLDLDVRRAAHQTLPAAQVDSEVFLRNPTYEGVDRMVFAGLALAVGALGLAVLLMAVDRLIADRRRTVHLIHLGAPASFLRRLGVVRFLAAYAVAAIVGLSVGYLVWLQSTSTAQEGLAHWPTMFRLASVLTISAILGCAAVATLGTTRAVRESE